MDIKKALLQQGAIRKDQDQSNQSIIIRQDPLRISRERIAMIYRVMCGLDIPGEREAVTIEDCERYFMAPTFEIFLAVNGKSIQLYQE